MFAIKKSMLIFAIFFILLGAIEAENCTSCSSVYQDLIAGVYDRNFQNFDRVLRLIDYNSIINSKAEILIQLYDVMDNAHHLGNPLREIPLFNAFESLINNNGSNMQSDQLHILQKRRTSLYFAIVNKGAEMLEAGVIMHECNSPNSVIQPLLEALYTSNETLSEETVTTMVNRVRWLLPLEELTNVLSTLSKKHVRQNVDAMLALYNPHQISDEFSIKYFMTLQLLTKDSEYASTVTTTNQMQVDELMPSIITQLMSDKVCLHKTINDTRYYLRECRQSRRACIYSYTTAVSEAVFNVIFNKNYATFNFNSNYYSRPLAIENSIAEQADGLRLNVHNEDYYKMDWKLQLENDRLILVNAMQDGTMYLCAGSQLAKVGQEWYAYTRSPRSFEKHKEECLWTVESC